MKKTYSELGWSEVQDILGMTHELQMLGEAILRPVEVEDQAQPDWNLSVIFTGFDFEMPLESVVERTVEFSPDVSTTDPEVVEEWVRQGEVAADAREALSFALSAAAETGEDDNPGAVIGEPGDHEPVEPITTMPGPPAIATEPTKVCKECEEEKPLSKFHKHPAFPDGKDNRCAQCRQAMRRKRKREKDRAEIQAEAQGNESTKVCRKCGEVKPLSEFGKNVRSRDGKAHTCSVCLSAAARIGAAARNSRVKESEAPPASDAEPEAELETKLCAHCGPEKGPKPLTAFARSVDLGNNPDGRVKVCRDCRSALSKRANTVGGNRQVTKSEQRENERIEQEAARIREREAESAPSPGPIGRMVNSLKEGMKVTVLPRAERVPEPHEIAAQQRPREDKVERFCTNDEDCVSYSQLNGPTKLAERNTDGRCFACQEAGVGGPGLPKMIVRQAADGTTR